MTFSFPWGEAGESGILQPPVPDDLRGQILPLRRGQVLNVARCQTDQCFRVRHGAVRVCRPLADGRRQITAFLFPGDWVGLEEVRTLGASIEAVTTAEVERFSLEMPAGMSPPSFGNVLALRDMLRGRIA